MTKTKTSSKNNNNNVHSELTEDIDSNDNRITVPQGFTAGVRPHKVGDSKNGRNIHRVNQSPGSQPATRHQALVTEYRTPDTGHPSSVSEYGPSDTRHQSPGS